MNMRCIAVIGSIALSLQACDLRTDSTTRLGAVQVSPVAWTCDNPSSTSVVEIPRGNFTGCVDFGKDHSVSARVLTDPGRFATVCPVTLEKPVFDSSCSAAVTSLLQQDDKMQISHYGKDDFRLTIWRHATGDLQASNLKLTPGPVTQGGISWLEGHETVQGRDFLYYVYLSNKTSSVGDLIKHYRLEVFEDGECMDQTPDITSLDDSMCNLAVTAKRGSHQGDGTGGDEPPPWRH